MFKEHWNARYVINRLKDLLLQKVHPDWPWLTKPAVQFLQGWLTPDIIVAEWGSGRSTTWFAKRAGHVYSVEHDAIWYSRVSAEIERLGLAANVDYHLVPIQNQESDCSEKKNEYIQSHSQFGMEFNLCVVDGLYRDICAMESIDLLCPGGVLMVDDVHRYLPRDNKSHSPHARGLLDGFASITWQHFYEVVKDWRCYWTTSGVSDTAWWVKP